MVSHFSKPLRNIYGIILQNFPNLQLSLVFLRFISLYNISLFLCVISNQSIFFPSPSKNNNSTVSRSGNENTFDELVRLYGESSHMEEKNRIVRVLGYSSDENIVKKALDFCLSVSHCFLFLKVRSFFISFSIHLFCIFYPFDHQLN